MDATGVDVRSKLERLIAERSDNYADLSRMLGRNPAYIQQFIKRGTPRKLDENDRRVLAEYFGISEADLGGPEKSDILRTNPASPQSTFVTIPRLSLGASAGAGSLDEDERTAGMMAFDQSLLRHLGVKGKQASIIRVDGESMSPTLGDGDDIMVNHSDGTAQLRDGVYVLRLDGVLMVKRIALGPRRGHFSILSDNPHYRDWTDIDPSLVTIVGRVVWTGRRLH